MGLNINFDPAPTKAILIGILLFVEAICAPMLILTQQGTMPTQTQIMTIILFALLQLVSYFLVFLGFKKGET